MVRLEVGATVLDLHFGVFWNNRFSTPRVAEDVFIDINDGSEVVQRMPITGEQDIVLEAKGNDKQARSYFTTAQILQIEQWEISGETITFTYGSESLQLRVPANPFNLTPLRDMEGHTDDDIWFGTIKFRRVI